MHPVITMRHALDHLAAQLVIASGNGSAVSGDKANVDIGFPIFDSAAKYVAGSKAKIKLMGVDARKAIDSLLPF